MARWVRLQQGKDTNSDSMEDRHREHKQPHSGEGGLKERVRKPKMLGKPRVLEKLCWSQR